MIKLKNVRLKLALQWAATIGILTITIYPIIISPIMDPTPYKQMQRVSREGINKESVQPGNMKVWSDPFKKKEDKASSS